MCFSRVIIYKPFLVLVCYNLSMFKVIHEIFFFKGFLGLGHIWSLSKICFHFPFSKVLTPFISLFQFFTIWIIYFFFCFYLIPKVWHNKE